MKTTIETITPKIAAEMLTHANPKNRGGVNRQERVRLYAKTMLAGLWLLTHQGIAFDESGMLVDGHHRLEAVVLSGCTVTMMVTRGCASTAMPGVDRGGGKTMKDLAAMIPGYPTAEALKMSRAWLGIGGRTAQADHEVVMLGRQIEPLWGSVSRLATLRPRWRVGFLIGAVVCAMNDAGHAAAMVDEIVAASRREIVPSEGVRNLLRWRDNEYGVSNGGIVADAAAAHAMIRASEQRQVGGAHAHIKATPAAAMVILREALSRLLPPQNKS
ncbi:MAG: hypothetical protein ACYDC2_03255 [Solirubrobacteraceae bacterium]